MSINRNNAYLLYSFFKVTLTKVSNAISFKTILNNRFLVFKIQRLNIVMNTFSGNCLIGKNPDIGRKVRMES